MTQPISQAHKQFVAKLAILKPQHDKMLADRYKAYLALKRR